MTVSTDSNAHTNGVVHATKPIDTERRQRLVRAAYAGASAGLRTFTVPATATRVKDNAWAPLFASLARTELVYDKLPDTQSRLEVRGLVARIIAAGASAASLSTRKDPAWIPYSAIAVATALATAWLGATIRIKGAEKSVPDLLLAAFEDQLAIHWASRAFPEPSIPREQSPVTKTFSLL